MDACHERMTLPDAVLELARSTRGWGEEHGENLGRCLVFTGGRVEPWCAQWVAWLFRQLGAPLPGDVVPTVTRGNPLANVAVLQGMLRMQGWRVERPERGDVVTWLEGWRHAGIVERISREGLVHVLAGNTSDVVRGLVYSRAALERIGAVFCRVPEPEGWRPPFSAPPLDRPLVVT